MSDFNYQLSNANTIFNALATINLSVAIIEQIQKALTKQILKPLKKMEGDFQVAHRVTLSRDQSEGDMVDNPDKEEYERLRKEHEAECNSLRAEIDAEAQAISDVFKSTFVATALGCYLILILSAYSNLASKEEVIFGLRAFLLIFGFNLIIFIRSWYLKFRPAHFLVPIVLVAVLLLLTMCAFASSSPSGYIHCEEVEFKFLLGFSIFTAASPIILFSIRLASTIPKINKSIEKLNTGAMYTLVFLNKNRK